MVLEVLGCHAAAQWSFWCEGLEKGRERDLSLTLMAACALQLAVTVIPAASTGLVVFWV